ncbi:hypothetical protein SAMN04490186_3975 [Pseudomonas grimontii]|uniref:Uncharacterized protein n=1 Tax=Pseudomonas grimontii TaxID=129847 RepID=A0A1H1H5M3_9PSED|nr:hypothetical protein [Pseudomonas grimontii]TWR67236.1 hypothetical protein FIV39_11115 [Pseudomonas grimontii]SDR20386.1 hypothetical protein SAMN04490186_3975 [Pseudomonas grimontii]
MSDNKGGISMLTLDQRLAALESAVSTTATAHTNAIAGIITAICNLPETDVSQLEKDLTELKSLPTQGVEPILYGNLIDLFISRIEHARK